MTTIHAAPAASRIQVSDTSDPSVTPLQFAGLAAGLGGVLSTVLRPLVATTWNNPAFGLTHEDYNRLMVARRHLARVMRE